MFNRFFTKPERVIPPINWNWTVYCEKFSYAEFSFPPPPIEQNMSDYLFMFPCKFQEMRGMDLESILSPTPPRSENTTTRVNICLPRRARNLISAPRQCATQQKTVCIRNDIYKPCVCFQWKTWKRGGTGFTTSFTISWNLPSYIKVVSY